MKKQLFIMAILAMGMSLASCSSDDDENNDNGGEVNAALADYTATNAKQWGNYMVAVSTRLQNDATTLYNDWAENYNGGKSYAEIFKAHNGTEGYNSALQCVQTIIEFCGVIANEVGTAKIGDPYNEYVNGDKTAALYMVESWYSWHSREDYSNNIISIQNAYYGSRNGKVDANSISALLAQHNPELDAKVKEQIEKTYNAILDIPNPFRNNIASDETVNAMNECAALTELFDVNIKNYLESNSATFTDVVLDPIVNQYVDGVILPTYKDLKDRNTALNNAVKTFAASPSDNGFKACATAWLSAREPWEESEAFLFGPVDTKQLDPNMDSWPLDQVAIYNILTSESWGNIDWSEGDSDDKIGEAQNVRGFHTLEFLIFKDGKARTIN